ncbi:glycosyl hydrolase [Micractinium conductrix]|uniref:Glycosyl hydrolase n=1 Tax=Micractinium conductrix TaxID=554055 RepID=A0A2P6VQ75_9CHLO|nr:glycosyl hydrolase [Micractinium conductrix]|eukprot:PSC76253.1 glycosyl hydrolase [Micractinium conductrix]
MPPGGDLPLGLFSDPPGSQHAVALQVGAPGDDPLLSSGAASRRSVLPAEAWAGFPPPEVAAGAAEVAALLSKRERKELEELCGRCLFEQLKMVIGYGNGHKAFVATGDIPFMWIRDSAVQLGALLPRMQQRPALRLLVEGAVRTQAFFIVQDPYANAYYLKWKDPEKHSKNERIIGRGGWVATRNYELDSGAYFLNLLWNLHSMPGYGRDVLLAEPVVFEAASLLVDVWTTEQHHEERSPYRYSELPRDGVGPPSNYTGMSWCGYRPSDDPQTYGYNVPVNMYAQAAVERALELNRLVWRDADFEKRAAALAASLRKGIEQWGIAEVEGQNVYAYEVDGLGNQLVDFDDANVPSLLSIPLLGYRHFDAAIYEATRARLLSPKNPWYFESEKLRGVGSPHTPPGYVWPLGLSVQGLTSHDPKERADLLRTLLKLQCGNGLMHESVSVSDLNACTRQWFGWANAMLVALVEGALGVDCAAPAERLRLAKIKEREARDTSAVPQNGGQDHELYYETLEDTIVFDAVVLKPPKDVSYIM